MTAPLVREHGPVTIRELLGSGDGPRLEAMLGLYGRLFPQYAHYIPRMRRRAEFGSEHRPGHTVHYWLVEVEGRPAALRTFRFVHGRHAGLAHALAVDPSYRDLTVGGQRLSMFLVRACLEQVIEDAGRNADGPALGIVNEVDSPRLMEHYKRNGIRQLPVRYQEPIFPSERAGRARAEELALIHFAPMILGFLPNPQVQVNDFSRTMLVDFSSAFLLDHYGLPAEHPQVQAVLDSIPTMQGELHD
jgi:GNAT superfamily N-acetyltransferase